MSIPTVSLGAHGIRTTRLGYGCAGLFRVSSPAERDRLLGAAYEAGIRHFDTAPMYGLGRAERALGSFARGRRAGLTIATKFGIRPTPLGRAAGQVQGPMRRAFAARPAVRERAQAHAASRSQRLYDRGGYDAVGARRSLERSLRSLRTDYVDLLLLHDPLPGSVRSEELCAYLEEARTAGLLRSWGIAGDATPTGDVAKSFPVRVPVQQVRDDVFLHSHRSVPDNVGVITFGALSGALSLVVRHVTATEPTRERWTAAVGADCGQPDVAAAFLLAAACRDNAAGTVLFSTTHTDRIAGAVAALDRIRVPDDPAMGSFLRLVGAELRQMPRPGPATPPFRGAHC